MTGSSQQPNIDPKAFLALFQACQTALSQSNNSTSATRRPDYPQHGSAAAIPDTSHQSDRRRSKKQPASEGVTSNLRSCFGSLIDPSLAFLHTDTDVGPTGERIARKTESEKNRRLRIRDMTERLGVTLGLDRPFHQHNVLYTACHRLTSSLQAEEELNIIKRALELEGIDYKSMLKRARDRQATDHHQLTTVPQPAKRARVFSVSKPAAVSNNLSRDLALAALAHHYSETVAPGSSTSSLGSCSPEPPKHYKRNYKQPSRTPANQENTAPYAPPSYHQVPYPGYPPVMVPNHVPNYPGYPWPVAHFPQQPTNPAPYMPYPEFLMNSANPLPPAAYTHGPPAIVRPFLGSEGNTSTGSRAQEAKPSSSTRRKQPTSTKSGKTAKKPAGASQKMKSTNSVALENPPTCSLMQSAIALSKPSNYMPPRANTLAANPSSAGANSTTNKGTSPKPVSAGSPSGTTTGKGIRLQLSSDSEDEAGALSSRAQNQAPSKPAAAAQNAPVGSRNDILEDLDLLFSSPAPPGFQDHFFFQQEQRDARSAQVFSNELNAVMNTLDFAHPPTPAGAPMDGAWDPVSFLMNGHAGGGKKPGDGEIVPGSVQAESGFGWDVDSYLADGE